MQMLFRNAEGNVPQADRDYAADKLSKLDRYFHKAQKVEMTHREDGRLHRIEVTVFADGYTVRAEERDESIRAAIDLINDKLEKRLRRLKKKLVDSHRRKGSPKLPPALEEPTPENDPDILPVQETKRFLLKPMSIEEAVLQMELLDHDFFVYRNQETNQMEVLYRRKQGGLGLLTPDA